MYLQWSLHSGLSQITAQYITHLSAKDTTYGPSIIPTNMLTSERGKPLYKEQII